eukprot:4059803-Heterocapsa_arctica.AAC.1
MGPMVLPRLRAMSSLNSLPTLRQPLFEETLRGLPLLLLRLLLLVLGPMASCFVLALVLPVSFPWAGWERVWLPVSLCRRPWIELVLPQ